MSRLLRSGYFWWKRDSCRVSPQGRYRLLEPMSPRQKFYVATSGPAYSPARFYSHPRNSHRYHQALKRWWKRIPGDPGESRKKKNRISSFPRKRESRLRSVGPRFRGDDPISHFRLFPWRLGVLARVFFPALLWRFGVLARDIPVLQRRGESWSSHSE